MSNARWSPPPPDRMSESRARMALGKKFPMWQRLGQLAERHGVKWGPMWRAANDLIEEGHAARDRHVLERARQYEREDAEYLREIEQRREARDERRRNARRNAATEDRQADR